MLRRLMVRLGADEVSAKAELAQAPQGDRAKLAKDATSLTVDESFDRAWCR